MQVLRLMVLESINLTMCSQCPCAVIPSSCLCAGLHSTFNPNCILPTVDRNQTQTGTADAFHSTCRQLGLAIKIVITQACSGDHRDEGRFFAELRPDVGDVLVRLLPARDTADVEMFTWVLHRVLKIADKGSAPSKTALANVWRKLVTSGFVKVRLYTELNAAQQRLAALEQRADSQLALSSVTCELVPGTGLVSCDAKSHPTAYIARIRPMPVRVSTECLALSESQSALIRNLFAHSRDCNKYTLAQVGDLHC